jgi:hypothetical protein
MGLYLTAANHAVRTQVFWILNELCQAFIQVFRLGQNIVPHTWQLNNRPGGYDIRASDLHQLPVVPQIRVVCGLMSQLNITTSMIYRILECREDHTKQLTVYGDVVLSDGEEES